MSASEQTTTYFTTRMAEIGITDANLHFTALDVAGKPVQRTRFTQEPNGDIRIWYYQLTGAPYFYHKTKAEGQRDWAKPMYRDRHVVPRITKEGKEAKYDSPPGSHICPYFTPQIIQAYQTKTKIPLLVLTEGEFKTVAGCNEGLHIVGITGIQGFYEPGSKKLHPDILELIKVCQVEKLLLLTDADTLTITYKPDTDLSQRPIFFYSSVKNFREAGMHFIETDNTHQLRDIYFGHIAPKHVNTGKGLDDLLRQFAHNKAGIVAALNALSFNSDYFYIQNVTDGLNKISEHFGLSSPEKFYTIYSEFIKEQEFVYKKTTYRWHEEDKQLTKILHGDIEKYKRVGCEWFKEVWIPSKYGLLAEIKKWKVGEIQRDYCKKFPTFLDDIEKLEAWANLPAMHKNYKRVIDNGAFGKCYNLFNPMQHAPAPGNFPNTVMFLKHLFKGKGNITFDGDSINETFELGDPFTIALDYLTLMYTKPTEILPVLCLVSPENNTGKTTFLKWLRDIYGSNATIIDNERFQQPFNAHYITKHVIGIDEGFLDVEKKREKERLKKMATDDRQYLEFKGSDIYEIDFYGKIIIASNDADNLMKIEDGEIRWWVVRVHPFTKEIPNLRDHMRTEIPAWLNYLQNRKPIHPYAGRAWFDPQYLKTEQLQIIIDKTRNRVDRVVDEFINDQLRTYQPYGCDELKIDLKGLSDKLNKDNYTKYKIDTTDLKNYLQDKRGMKAGKPERIRLPINIAEGTDAIIYDTSRVARCYIFTYAEWVKTNEIEREDKPLPAPAKQLELKAEEKPFDVF